MIRAAGVVVLAMLLVSWSSTGAIVAVRRAVPTTAPDPGSSAVPGPGPLSDPPVTTRAGRMVGARYDPGAVRATGDDPRSVTAGADPSPTDPARVVTATPDPLRAVLGAIDRAAREFGVAPGRMVGVAFCESSFDPGAVGDAGERGLFQFLEETWLANAPALGYGPADVWDPVAASRVTARMWAAGKEHLWTCAR